MSERKIRKMQSAVLSIWNILGSGVILGFFLFSFVIGGSAMNGFREGNTFFVGEHGIYTQVSASSWNVSYTWGILFWAFLFLTPLGAFLISRIFEKILRRKNRFE